MQREISNKIFLSTTVSPFDDVRNSSAINRTASNCTDAKEKVKRIRELNSTGKYDVDIARYIPGILEMKFQGMLEDIDTREKVAHSSYKARRVRFSNITDRKLLCKPEQHPSFFSNENKKVL